MLLKTLTLLGGRYLEHPNIQNCFHNFVDNNITVRLQFFTPSIQFRNEEKRDEFICLYRYNKVVPFIVGWCFNLFENNLDCTEFISWPIYMLAMGGLPMKPFWFHPNRWMYGCRKSKSIVNFSNKFVFCAVASMFALLTKKTDKWILRIWTWAKNTLGSWLT